MKRDESDRTGAPIARWWRTEADGRVLCALCPRYCRLHEGQAGFCFIRQNAGGELVSLGYGRPTGFAADPIEKKPLNHFLPGSSILSFGTAGCNLGCKFCQNWTMTKARADETRSVPVTPDDVIRLARGERCESIAYTYNDPVIFGEFVIDVSARAREAGLKNVMVTAGYVTAEARGDLFRHVDGANVDLKAFTDRFYQKFSLARLGPVLDTLIWLRRETEVWLEITTLLIPGLNDGEEEIREECRWIRDRLGASTPLHFTAFHPDFRMTDRPRTPPATLRRAREIARAEGLRFVYLGNIHDAEGGTTRCPSCGAALIERDGHSVRRNLLKSGACPECGEKIPGVWG
ncbi:MAG: AmmeMemoRadiSam system radical SAM enzyme [Candidatus Eisenbacteria bacterium]